MFPFKKINLS